MTKIKKKNSEASARGKKSRNKGATYERKIAKIFKEFLGIELTRTPQSGGFAKKNNKAEEFKGDLTCLEEDKQFLIHVEAKNQAKVQMRKWLQQAESDCPKNKYPIVVFHLGQEITRGKVTSPNMGDYVTIKLEDFLYLVNQEKVIKEENKNEI